MKMVIKMKRYHYDENSDSLLIHIKEGEKVRFTY